MELEHSKASRARQEIVLKIHLETRNKILQKLASSKRLQRLETYKIKRILLQIDTAMLVWVVWSSTHHKEDQLGKLHRKKRIFLQTQRLTRNWWMLRFSTPQWESLMVKNQRGFQICKIKLGPQTYLESRNFSMKILI